MSYELKPRDIERRFLTCELLLDRQRKKGFLHRIVTGNEKWTLHNNSKRKRSWGKLGHASTSAKPNIHRSNFCCIWCDQRGVISYELRLCRSLKQKELLYEQRHDKVILLQDNARPHVTKLVKTYLEALKWKVSQHLLYSPNIAPSDYHLFRSMAHGSAVQHFHSYTDTKKWVYSWIV